MPNPLFILCPLRSFSSLVCGMLGQHPEYMGMPELNLFLDDAIVPLHRKLERRGRGNAKSGILRALAELRYGEQTESAVDRASDWLYHTPRDTREVLHTIMELAAPRAIIDKSPATVMDPDALARIVDYVPDARYLHLTRHPRACCRSMLDFVATAGDWAGRVPAGAIDPEHIWLEAQVNIVNFCERLPLGQWMRIRGEDLLADPDTFLPQIFEWLEVSTDAPAIEASKHPEASPFACQGPANAAWGNDPKFLADPVFRPGQVACARLAGPLEWAPDRCFRPETMRLARELGYGD